MIDKELNKRLRERYCPEGSVQERQHKVMLDILLEVDRICRKHGLKYWLDSGTLIGAVRHGGFIPWDDDLDIGMMKDDYDRLMKILPEELPENMAVQNQETDSNYFHFYTKIRDKKSLLVETPNYGKFFKEQGIFIDVFPFERNSKWIHLLSEKLQGHVYKMMRLGFGDGDTNLEKEKKIMRRVMMITRFNARITFPVLRFFCRIFGGEVTDSFGIPYHNPRPLKYLFPISEMEFEGHKLMVPNDSDAILRLIYGDYMKLPNLETTNYHVTKLEFYE